jgi:hypothetical protein
MWGYVLDPLGTASFPLAGACEHGKETSGSTTLGNIMTSWAVNRYQFLITDSGIVDAK